MIKKLTRLDILFLLAGLLFLAFCFSFYNRSLDIAIHDTYIILDMKTIGAFLFVVHAIYAFVYFLIRKNRKYLLGLFHLGLGTPLFAYIAFGTLFVMGGSPRRYYPNSDPSIFYESIFPDSFSLISILFLLGQLIFIANILFAVIKSVRHRDA